MLPPCGLAPGVVGIPLWGSAPVGFNPIVPGMKHVRRRLGATRNAAGHGPLSSFASRSCSLQFQREEFAFRISGNAGRHSRHVIGDVERLLAIGGAGRAGARRLELIVRCFHVEASAIFGTRPGKLLQFQLAPRRSDEKAQRKSKTYCSRRGTRQRRAQSELFCS